MRLLRIIVLIALVSLALLPAQAQSSTYRQGAYEWESQASPIPMTYNGTWSTVTVYGNVTRTTSVAASNLTFFAEGKQLIIWRLMRSVAGGASSMNVCLGSPTVCTLVSNLSAHPDGYFESYVVDLAPGSNLVTIQWVSGQIWLDKFMILADPQLYLTSIVPTATILPSSTPAFTATPAPTSTPGPSPTPAPTSTPAPTTTPITLIWALDPAKSYGDVNGQITSVEYTASAADVHIANLLTFLVVSVWGFFIFAVFVLVKYRVDKK